MRSAQEMTAHIQVRARARMKELHRTGEDIARELDTSEANVSNWLSRPTISLSTLARLAGVLKMSPTALIMSYPEELLLREKGVKL